MIVFLLKVVWKTFSIYYGNSFLTTMVINKEIIDIKVNINMNNNNNNNNDNIHTCSFGMHATAHLSRLL